MLHLEIPDKCDWSPRWLERSEEKLFARAPFNHIIHWLRQAHVPSAMIKTNTGKGEGERDSERHKESAGMLEGGGGQTDKEWVRQADILLHGL